MSFIFLRNRVTGGAAFSPASLFASGEDGAWYEPSTTTAFLSTTDLTPCDYGQSAGFLLDLSKGAGYSGGSFTGTVEQLTNGDFSTGDFTGWSDVGTSNATYAVTAGAAVITRGVGAAGAGIYQDISVSAGDIFVFSVDVEAVTGTAQVAVFGAAAFTPLLSQQNVLQGNTTTITGSIVVTTQTTLRLYLNLQSKPGGGVFDNATFALIPGNHATQATAAARPILARVPSGGRRNLLERTEEFDDAVWVKNNTIIDNNSGDGYTDPNGGSSALKLIATANAGYVRQQETSISTVNTSAIFSLIDGSFQSSLAGSYDSINSTNEGNGWWRFECTKNGATLSVFAKAGEWDYIGIQMYLTNIYFYPVQTSTSAGTADGTSGVYIWGAQLEAASSATAYQKVVDQYDITEAGVTSLDYLFDDEADDAISWTAPADTDYTIARVDTSGNVTILTGQSLSGATDILLEQDIAGYVAADRALTSQETTDLTAYLETLA